MLRILLCIILFVLLCPRWSDADELIRGVLAFDPPPFLAAGAVPGDRTNSPGGIREIRRYAATDNDPRTSQRLVIVCIRQLGGVPNSGSGAMAQPPDDAALRDEMQRAIGSTRNATNATSVANAQVGGQAAWLASYQIPRPYWQKPAGELFPCDVYWVKVQTNQVVEIKLIASSPEQLQTLRACLPRFQFAK